MDIVRSHILVCGGTGCTANHSVELMEALESELKAQGLDKEVKVVQTGCHGLCELGPIMVVYPEGAFYSRVTPEDAKEIVSEHLMKGRIVTRLLYQETVSDGEIIKNLAHTNFYAKQHRVALRNCGVINPEIIEEYIAVDGYEALGRVLTTMQPQQVIDAIKSLRPPRPWRRRLPHGHEVAVCLRARPCEVCLLQRR